jgi:hypothetical protein
MAFPLCPAGVFVSRARQGNSERRRCRGLEQVQGGVACRRYFSRIEPTSDLNHGLLDLIGVTPRACSSSWGFRLWRGPSLSEREGGSPLLLVGFELVSSGQGKGLGSRHTRELKDGWYQKRNGDVRQVLGTWKTGVADWEGKASLRLVGTQNNRRVGNSGMQNVDIAQSKCGR